MAIEFEILIADDHPIVRQGLRQAIEATANMKVVAEVGNGQEALEQLRLVHPDIAVLDVDMPIVDGFTIAQKLREEGTDTKVVFLTVHREESFLNKALKVGARGYILKDSSLADIIAGIQKVCAGHPFISPSMTPHLFNNHLAQRGKQGLETLTPTERTVLKLIADYKTTREIAALLFISPRTVETHRANICQKLRLSGSHVLMKFALSHQTEL